MFLRTVEPPSGEEERLSVVKSDVRAPYVLDGARRQKQWVKDICYCGINLEV